MSDAAQQRRDQVNSGALQDIRVVELGQLIAGPFCGQLLGDMGADVIKVEPPVTGDPMRGWGQGAEKVQWEVIARNKRSVSANLRVVRCKSRTPRRPSNSAMRRDRRDLGMPSSRPAAAKPPASTTRAK